MSTPHISAAPGAFADVVLLPGDPLRAAHVAERFLESPERVNEVRGMFGYTGRYRGRRVSVMGHGMGGPSMSIYATELATVYGARVLLRVGSCGATTDDVKLRDLVIATGAGTDSAANRLRFGGYDLPAVADFGLVRRAVEAAERAGLPHHVGPVFSSDFFYHPDERLIERLRDFGIGAIEMEASALYAVAARHGVRALALLTVSDQLRTGEKLTPAERQLGFDAMIAVALEVGCAETERPPSQD